MQLYRPILSVIQNTAKLCVFSFRHRCIEKTKKKIKTALQRPKATNQTIRVDGAHSVHSGVDGSVDVHARAVGRVHELGWGVSHAHDDDAHAGQVAATSVVLRSHRQLMNRDTDSHHEDNATG